MSSSSEIRLLKNKWETRSNINWPKFLEWIEISGLRGWSGQRIEFTFPIVAIVGENGSGKSTILQAAASVYQSEKGQNKFASDFFPDTPWDSIRQASIYFSYKQGNKSIIYSVRKPTDRWRGNPNRPQRNVNYIDLGRVQPVSARTGYRRLANPQFKETNVQDFEKSKVDRLSEIVGRKYEFAKMALTNGDSRRHVPVIGKNGIKFSGFHQGAGETMITELIQVEPIQNGLILIDEIETSLHPRAQRRLIRDLAKKCHILELQIILTTHSAYILDELPLEARLYIIDGLDKKIARGISPEFAMTKMDEEPHPECDIYVEDKRGAILLREILYRYRKDDIYRCSFISFGAASVGTALGQMLKENRFPRPSCIYLDGDQPQKPGCNLLPGGDAPERVIFSSLEKIKWQGVYERIGRSVADVGDACQRVMSYSDHHEWIKFAAEQIYVTADSLWEALCSVWVANCLEDSLGRETIKPIEEALGKTIISSTVQGQLF